jgi:hypothetical protein
VKAPDLFATDAPPASARPREAVVLTRMTDEEKAEASSWLRDRGYRIVSSARVASLALVGEGVGKDELRQLCAMTGRALTLRELKASQPPESTTSETAPAPVREPEPEPLLVVDGESVRLAGITLPKRQGAGLMVPPAA